MFLVSLSRLFGKGRPFLLRTGMRKQGRTNFRGFSWRNMQYPREAAQPSG